MDNEQYEYTQHTMLILARSAMTLDMDAFLERVDQAESIGPLLDPTLYREAGERLRHVKGIATAVRDFQRAINKLGLPTLGEGGV